MEVTEDEPCPLQEKHTDAPREYYAFMRWATEMSRTHIQVMCEGCGLYKIWIPK